MPVGQLQNTDASTAVMKVVAARAEVLNPGNSVSGDTEAEGLAITFGRCSPHGE
jgi:hypothetical protein